MSNTSKRMLRIRPLTKTLFLDLFLDPKARPIFIYVNLKSAKKPEVRAFVRFYLKQAKELAKEVGYVPLPDQDYQKYLDKFENDFLKLAKR